jgi:hypothetical protein
MGSTIIRRAGGAALVAAFAIGVTAPSAVAATGGGKQLTKKQWIKAANSICDEADEEISSLRPPTADPTADQPLTDAEFADLEEFLQSAVDTSEDALADLRALQPPKKDAAKIRKILVVLKENVAVLRDAVRASKDGEQEAIAAAIETSGELSTQFETAAGAYGSTCGASGSS